MKTTIKYLLILFTIAAHAQLEQITTTYSYDNLNRLVQVVFDDGTTKNYVYDDLGNRIQLDIDTSSLSIDEASLKNAITLYPNPTSNEVTITLPHTFKDKEVQVRVFDMSGKLIISEHSEVQDQSILTHVGSLSHGVYLIRLSGNKQQWSKIIIKK